MLEDLAKGQCLAAFSGLHLVVGRLHFVSWRHHLHSTITSAFRAKASTEKLLYSLPGRGPKNSLVSLPLSVSSCGSPSWSRNLFRGMSLYRTLFQPAENFLVGLSSLFTKTENALGV